MSLGWISPTTFSLDPDVGYQAADALEPWQAYWFLVTIEEGVVALVPPV